MKDIVVAQLRRQWGHAAIEDELRTRRNVQALERNSGRTGCTGRTDDIAGIRTQGMRIRRNLFFADVLRLPDNLV